MKLERAILIVFLGNYLVNNVAAAIAAFVPGGTGAVTPQYVAFIVLAAVVIGVMYWWYGASNLKNGAIFGVIGFLTAIVTAFITGVSGVLIQTASFPTLVSVLPNFWPFLASWSTLVLLCYWVIPAALVGWWLGRSSAPSAM
jgi:hypothetical protein